MAINEEYGAPNRLEGKNKAVIVCWFLGLGCLVSWNGMLTIGDYYYSLFLAISARKGEFETGYERGGQTHEHVQIAKTLGVSKLLVVVNKMDDPTVNWSKQRYDEIESKMVPFLKSSGYNVKKDVQFLPISGMVGSNMKTIVNKVYVHGGMEHVSLKPLMLLKFLLEILEVHLDNFPGNSQISSLEHYPKKGISSVHAMPSLL